jgi:hypothetical protein
MYNSSHNKLFLWKTNWHAYFLLLTAQHRRRVIILIGIILKNNEDITLNIIVRFLLYVCVLCTTIQIRVKTVQTRVSSSRIDSKNGW